MAKKFVRRGRFEIMNEILTTCITSAQKTHILYKCNLSFDQLNKYLNLLVSLNLLAFVSKDGKVLYKTTEKGNELTKGYKRLGRFLAQPSSEG